MKKYVSGLTFHGGSPSWKFAAHRLCMQSEKFEAFSEFSIYNPRKLSLEFKMQHKNLIERHPRGFGLWIWKPQILLQQFRSYPCAEFYFYQDAGGEATQQRRAEEFSNIIWKELSNLEYLHFSLNTRPLIIQREHCCKNTLRMI